MNTVAIKKINYRIPGKTHKIFGLNLNSGPSPSREGTSGQYTHPDASRPSCLLNISERIGGRRRWQNYRQIDRYNEMKITNEGQWLYP